MTAQIHPRPAYSDLPRILSTVLFVGHLPGPAGTWGSLAALLPAFVLSRWGGPLALAAAAALVAVIGIWASALYARDRDLIDPSEVVIDEVAGQWATLVLVPPEPLYVLLGFLVFRALDILKPGPIGWCDRNLPGGFGIVVDDVLAGLIGMVVLWGVSALW